MKIDENTKIKCNTQEEVIDCLKKLTGLGFNTDYSCHGGNNFIEYKSYCKTFSNTNMIALHADDLLLSYKEFLEKYDIQPTIVFDRAGRILEIVNSLSEESVFYYNYNEIIETRVCDLKDLNFNLDFVDLYISRETCERAIKRKETEHKLRKLAYKLNGNRDASWVDDTVQKHHLQLLPEKDSISDSSDWSFKAEGIYCYSKYFAEEAKKAIGVHELRDYLRNY